jgi:hypothetical protein
MSAVRPLLVLGVTIALAVGVFVAVDARTDDVSGATPGISATAVIGVGVDERDLVAASDAAWGLATRSQGSATVITILIVVIMVPALDQAWAASDALLAPLGLHGAQRPDVAFLPRLAGEGLQSDLVGPTVLRGERHGRAVQLTIGDGRSETHVACASSAYALRGYHRRVRTDGDPQPPPAVRALLDELGPSARGAARARRGCTTSGCPSDSPPRPLQ